MKKCLPFLFIAMMMMTMLNAQTTLALWTFDDLPGEQTPPPYKAFPSNTDFGVQMGTAFIYADGTNGSSDFINSGSNPQLNSFSGYTLNDPRTPPNAGKDLGIANQTSNNKSIVFKFSTTGYQNIILTFACRGSGTGFNSHLWAYSTDGVNFTDYPDNNTSSRESSYSLKTVDFTGVTAIADKPNVYIRLTVNGATSGSGNNRFDNIKIDAETAGPDVIPPRILSHTVVTPTTLKLSFNEALTPATATAIANYVFTQSITVTNAVLSNEKDVTLTLNSGL